MADSKVLDIIRSAGLAAGDALDRAWRSIGAPWRRLASMGLRAPDRLLIAPQDIRTADPTVAADIYAGFYSFAGRAVNAHGKSPFELPPPSPGWGAALASFAWLRHLRAAETALARDNARALVDDFLSLAGRNEALPVWDAKVAARRLIAWLGQSPMLLADVDPQFYRRFMRALARHGARLQAGLVSAEPGETRLLICIALAMLGLCGAGMDGLQRRATRLLARELARQILPDGGHIGRNPQTLIDLLLDLLPLRQVYASRGVEAPAELLNAIDRMLPMLRLLRHADGSLATFNGMGVTPPHMVASVLAYDDARAAPVNAPYAGYQRLEANGATLIMDAGAPPPRLYSGRAHAGHLAIEFSADGQMILCSCGAPEETRPDLRQMARATAAHSTLVVADTSSSRFASGGGLAGRLGGRVVAGPRKVEVSRQDSPAGPGLIASHDGYEREFGLLHERALRLASDGSRLVGADRLLQTGSRAQGRDRPYVVRFHLHPAIQVLLSEDGGSATLTDGKTWRFHANGMRLELEASIFFASASGPRPTTQIVIAANSAATPAINWSLERV